MHKEGRIKVLTISTSGFAFKEGISTILLDYYSRLDRNKYEIHIIVSGNYREELIEDFKKIGVIMHYLPSRKENTYSYYRAYAKLFKESNFDVVYIHGSSAIMAIEFYIAKLFGCKIRIAHSHNTQCNHVVADKFLRPFFYHILTERLACGKEAGEWLYGNHAFTVIKNGRDPFVYSFKEKERVQKRKMLGLDDDCLAIGHVGNFNEQKNQAFLIDVFKIINTRCKKAKLFLMGEGNKREAIMKIVEHLNLQDDIAFTGSVMDMADMLQAMDLMVLPSIYEGLPLVVVEWQMAGLPCIVSDNVTRECTFTQLVTYLRLDDPYEWADKILGISSVDRKESSFDAINAAKHAGFDINDSVSLLDTILSNEA